uniref:Phosphatidic acid phosphatase type 2/haloperoxidase domain-containing protein n=1 Tax=Araucaria cunninghamii TaxID=56994 RepID=A0A0D6QTI8_ARACU
MRPQGGTYTLRQHGVQLLRYHKHDWLMVVLLLVIEVVLNAIHPFYRFVGKDMMTDLRYPMKSNTVPIWSVPIYAMLLPILVFVIFNIRKKDVNDLHHAILGLLFSIFITAVITDSIKDAVGRPRPDFFWRCFPDGKEVYDPVTTDVICHGDSGVIREGHKSFPSGHTSWSFAGLGYLSMYLAGKIQIFDRRGHAAKLCIVFLPLLAAALVGVSRVDDYWHHWQDVFAGGLIGLVIATLCYRQFFPAPYDSTAGIGPYAYFEINTSTHANEMGNVGGHHDSSSDNRSEILPYFTPNGEQTRESASMPARGNEAFFDIENGRRLKSIVESGPPENFMEKKGYVGKGNPFELGGGGM